MDELLQLAQSGRSQMINLGWCSCMRSGHCSSAGPPPLFDPKRAFQRRELDGRLWRGKKPIRLQAVKAAPAARAITFAPGKCPREMALVDEAIRTGGPTINWQIAAPHADYVPIHQSTSQAAPKSSNRRSLPRVGGTAPVSFQAVFGQTVDP
jgi:hypothetical protein